MKSTTIIITFALLLISEGIFAQSFKIIVNPGNSITSLTKKEVSDLFLKKKTTWANGSDAKPVDLTSDSKVREDFTQQVHGKSISAIRNYWQQMTFLGTTTPPPEKSSDTDVIEFVKKNAGAIGYVSSGATTEGVKKININ
jgi:ABC-type phosphate transport system substrate-binding protein